MSMMVVTSVMIAYRILTQRFDDAWNVYQGKNKKRKEQRSTRRASTPWRVFRHIRLTSCLFVRSNTPRGCRIFLYFFVLVRLLRTRGVGENVRVESKELCEVSIRSAIKKLFL